MGEWFGGYEMDESREQPHRRGVQHLKRFPNGYSASIVRSIYSYGGAAGLWEIAVLQDEQIVYTTPITDDVLGHLTEEQAAGVLQQIEALPKE